MALGGAWVIAMVAFAIVLLKGRATAPQPVKVTAGDDGVLEVLDPDHDAWQRIELHGMAVGEVWLIGHAEHCQIRLDEVADEVAAIVMTPDGPQIDSRGTPLVVDGDFVHSHRLFDNDEVYVGRLIVLYQNFFRQRLDRYGGRRSCGSPYHAPTSNVQPPTIQSKEDNMKTQFKVTRITAGNGQTKDADQVTAADRCHVPRRRACCSAAWAASAGDWLRT